MLFFFSSPEKKREKKTKLIRAKDQQWAVSLKKIHLGSAIRNVAERPEEVSEYESCIGYES